MNVQDLEWKHRRGCPGYFVTTDNKYQTLLDDNSQFVICSNRKSKNGYRVIAGPVEDPGKLGIPSKLIDEADVLSAAQITRDIKAGKEVVITLSGDLAKDLT